MGILEFFHKITMYFVRDSEDFIPDMNEAQRYGNDGEDALIRILCREMPCCKIKRNVFVSTDEGNAEIDCLVLYRDKLFAIEVKCWKGKLIDQGDDFLQEKTDTLTEQVYRKHLKSPFKQLGRAVYLLKKQIPVKAWINTVVFFEADALASISVRSDDVWFERIPDLVNYIRNNGRPSFGTGANDFFEKCIPADCLYDNVRESIRHCRINRDTLRFESLQGTVSAEQIVSIDIEHHWHYDNLHITLTDGSKRWVSLENAKIQINDHEGNRVYALCHLDYIELGRTILP